MARSHSLGLHATLHVLPPLHARMKHHHIPIFHEAKLILTHTKLDTGIMRSRRFTGIDCGFTGHQAKTESDKTEGRDGYIHWMDSVCDGTHQCSLRAKFYDRTIK